MRKISGFATLIIIALTSLSLTSVGDSSLWSLSKIINAECSICPTYEKYLVGSVILNRVDSPHFPNTIEGVIKQDNQFYGYNTLAYDRTAKSDKIAKDLVRGINRSYNIYYFVEIDKSLNKEFNKFVLSSKNFKAKYHTFKIGL